MAENRRMCIYCKDSMENSGRFYCNSPGNERPDFAGFKNLPEFQKFCRCADENGYQCSCGKFIEPQIHRDEPSFGQNAEKGGMMEKEPRRRAVERLTYLARMDSKGSGQNGKMIDSQSKQDSLPAGDQEEQDSSLTGKILKAGAKAAVDIGKTLVNPLGAGADFAAEVAKNIIDEL